MNRQHLFKRSLIVAALMILPAAYGTAQDIKLPEVIADGLKVYKDKGAEAAVERWVQGSPAEGQKNALAESNVLLQVEAFYGSYQSYELINIKKITATTQAVYVQLNYENGPVFAYFIIFQKGNAWIITSFQFHTDPMAILPREYVS